MSTSRSTLIVAGAAMTACLLVARGADAQPQEPAAAAAPPAPAPSPQIVYVRDEARGPFGPRYRSPGLAAVLSLTPVPVDFGNLYAEHVAWGMVYTTAELGLATGMMWLGADHMCHRDGCQTWSGGETAGMVALATGYVAVKIVAGLHAASAAREFNERAPVAWSPLVAPTRGGVALGLAGTF